MARAAWRFAVIARLGAPQGASLSWSEGPMPGLAFRGAVVAARAFAGADARRLLHDDSARTALELADGNWGSVAARVGGPDFSSSVERLAGEFDLHLAPAARQPRTRGDQWRAWQVVLTWAVARDAVHRILPMDTTTLKALTWDLITFAASSSHIQGIWDAVQARHRRFGMPPPLHERNQYSTWLRMLHTVRGQPLALKLPIQSSTVKCLLAWRPQRFAEHRARLLTALATIACLRVGEVVRLQVCDLWFDHLTAYGVPGFEGTCSIHIDRRKNDTVRKGHYPALGRSADPGLDIVVQLRSWMRLAGLAVDPNCQKRTFPAARCPRCPPLFPTTRRGAGGETLATATPCSRQQASDFIRRAVESAGGASGRFSGISARKGGISVAIAAGVDETILYLQSGHGQPRPARAYMQLVAPARFLETFNAFGL